MSGERALWWRCANNKYLFIANWNVISVLILLDGGRERVCVPHVRRPSIRLYFFYIFLLWFFFLLDYLLVCRCAAETEKYLQSNLYLILMVKYFNTFAERIHHRAIEFKCDEKKSVWVACFAHLPENIRDEFCRIGNSPFHVNERFIITCDTSCDRIAPPINVSEMHFQLHVHCTYRPLVCNRSNSSRWAYGNLFYFCYSVSLTCDASSNFHQKLIISVFLHEKGIVTRSTTIGLNVKLLSSVVQHTLPHFPIHRPLPILLWLCFMFFF